MHIELGGGAKPKEGYINVDRCGTADVILDFESQQLPWPDSTAEAVYSSHCLEHIRNLGHIVSEIVRVCKPGAVVEIRVPHWASEMGLCFDHKQVIPEQQAAHFQEFPQDWGYQGAYLKWEFTEYVENANYQEACTLFPTLTREQIFRYIQNTCHEVAFYFRVVK